MRIVLAVLVLAAVACGGKQNPTPERLPDQPAVACVKGGCSGSVCEEEGTGTVTTCEMKPEYACYQSATCERQADGACGWTQTPELTACLASPPPIQ
jgi:hypothetical protein